MFIPRLRRITNVVKEMRNSDPDTAISYYFLQSFFKDGKIKAIKYGNAWLINLDELYAFFTANGGKENETTNEDNGTDSEIIF